MSEDENKVEEAVEAPAATEGEAVSNEAAPAAVEGASEEAADQA